MNVKSVDDILSVVLAGGEATRMRPLSLCASKVMLPFLGRPLLAYLLDNLARSGLTRALLTGRGRDDDIQRYFGNGARTGLHLDYLEPGPWRGTAGTVAAVLAAAPAAVSSPFLVIYGDSLLRLDYRALMSFHRSSKAAFTIACHRPRFEQFLFQDHGPEGRRTNFGVVDLQPDGVVTRFEEKPCLHRIGSTFVRPVANAAVYVVEPDVLRDTCGAQQSAGLDFGHDVIPRLIARGERVCGMDIVPGFRIDIGTLPHYISVQLAALRGKVPIDVEVPANGIWIEQEARVHPGAILIPPVFVGAGAVVSVGATLASAIVGARTTIGEGAVVRESVLLENATIGAGAHVDGSVIGPDTRVYSQAVLPRGTVIGAWSRVGGPGLVLSAEEILGLVEGRD